MWYFFATLSNSVLDFLWAILKKNLPFLPLTLIFQVVTIVVQLTIFNLDVLCINNIVLKWLKNLFSTTRPVVSIEILLLCFQGFQIKRNTSILYRSEGCEPWVTCRGGKSWHLSRVLVNPILTWHNKRKLRPNMFTIHVKFYQPEHELLLNWLTRYELV